MVSQSLAILALAARIGLLGYERILAKQLTAGRTSIGATFLFFAAGALIWGPALLWSGLLPLEILGWASVASFVYAGAFLLYIGALARSDASLIGPLYHTSILVVIGLAWIVLEEAVTPLRAVGGVVLLYGAGMLEHEGSPWAIVQAARKLLADTGARMMLVGASLLGAGRVIDKWIITQVATDVPLGALKPATSYAVLETVLVVFWIGLALVATRQLGDTVELARERPGKALLAGGINLGSYVLLLLAFTGLDASIADPASSLSMLVTVALGGLIFGEAWRSRLPGAVLMCIGAWLLFL